MHNSNVSCQISFSRSPVITILARIKDSFVLVVIMKPQGLLRFAGISTFQTCKFSKIFHKICLNLAHCTSSYLKNYNSIIDKGLSLSIVDVAPIKDLMISRVRSSSSSEHNPSGAQLTCDRKYETVESAELPEIQLFVMDLLNSIPSSAFQPVQVHI